MIARAVRTCVDNNNDNVFHGDFFPDVLHFSSPIRDIIELKCVVIHRFIRSTLAPDFPKVYCLTGCIFISRGRTERTAGFYINLSVVSPSVSSDAHYVFDQ